MTERPRYWFPAKRYGWGWGFPATWEGWAVLVGFVALLIGGAWIFRPDRNPLAYHGWAIFLAVIFLAICRFKGEPPRWRWGKD